MRERLKREALIRDLAADLKPIRWPGRVLPRLVAWLSLAVLFSFVAFAATGPFRDGAFQPLLSGAGFAAETLVASLAVFMFARAALLSSIPAPGGALRLLSWPCAILGVWLGFLVVGLWFPAHPVSILGYRDHCLGQTQLVALANLIPLLWMARRLMPLRPRLTGALAGVAAAAVPAAVMQFACMYDPAHILSFHFAPVVMTAVIGALLGPVTLVRPRGRDRP
jgi:hypothetical protein